MPFSASDLEWWTWLLLALGAGLVFALGVKVANEDHKPGRIMGVAMCIVSAIGGIGCLIIALVRFVKWAWNG